MLELTMTSAIWRIWISSMRSANVFQEFHPMGGVRAKLRSGPSVAGMAWATRKADAEERLAVLSGICGDDSRAFRTDKCKQNEI
jgi:hypothetical protein